MSIGEPRKLTQDEIIVLITDIAYEQSSRECSGLDWFNKFLKKINEYQYPKQKEQ